MPSGACCTPSSAESAAASAWSPPVSAHLCGAVSRLRPSLLQPCVKAWNARRSSSVRPTRVAQSDCTCELPADPGQAAPCRPDLLEQLTLPLRHAGFGLHVMSETEADAALLTGAAIGQNVMAEGPAACRPLEPGSAMRALLLPRWQRVHAECHADCGWIEEAVDLDPEFVKHMLPTAAHDVARAVTDARGKALLDACDTATPAGQQKAARLRSASGAAAGAWLEALPCVPATRLTSAEFKSAGRHRLGLGLTSNVRTPACTCRRGIASDADHAMVCDHARGEGTMRHDIMTSVWRCLFRKAGLPSSMEPRLARIAGAAQDIQRAGARRADISTVIGTEMTLTDTVTEDWM